MNSITRRQFMFALPALTAATTAHAIGLKDVETILDRVVRPARVIGVLVDVSGSIAPDELEIYRRAMSQMVTSLRRGDRVIGAEISARTQPQFRLAFEVGVPDTGHSNIDKAVASTKSNEIISEFEKLATRPTRAARSCIADAVAGMGDALATARERARSLLILSDMLEDSAAGGNFLKPLLTVKQMPLTMSRLKASGLARDLAGVEITICGAAGRDGKHYTAVREFWHLWLQNECRARIAHYGRTAPGTGGG